MEWYMVTKTIHGRKYLYWQKTYRVGSSVKTLNKYIGPGANPPRERSLKATMASLPQKHKNLRKQYDTGKLSKTEYLEAIATSARIDDLKDKLWSSAWPERKQLRAEIDALLPPRQSHFDAVTSTTTTAHDQAVAEHRQLLADTKPLPKEPEQQYSEPPPRRADYTAEEWRELKEEKKEYEAGMKGQAAKVRKAKRATRGIKSLNPFLARGIKK